MKKVILILLLGVFNLTSVQSQAQPASSDTIVVTFGESGKIGELIFDEDTGQFLSGWISYAVPNGGGLYYHLPVNSVSGILIGGGLTPIPIDPLGDDGSLLQGEIDITETNYLFFSGTIYYGKAQEWGSLLLHSGNNIVLQSAN